MLKINTIKELQIVLDQARSQGKTIGLVPTMGALHKGHASLVRRSVSQTDFTVVSDFVNPTQFNDKNDLKNYPRTLDADCALLEKEGAHVLFAPSVEEMYPEPDMRQFDFTPLDKVMEGIHRPGHFNGVAQIVSKLFYAVKPDFAYFGEKDFQQLAIIRRMVEQLGLDVEIVGCPIVREEDGMALSSRNALLSKADRKIAANISKVLFNSRVYAKDHSLAQTEQYVVDTINSIQGLEVEYYEIVDGTTLQRVRTWDDSHYIVGCITVHCGGVRLIDNIKYKE
ncbi:MAG: pantoate--beta-alanine ligase [Bacteroidaceae bacterium]|nr:pantoate--beta-alanine ligase [Bacteroidaceae bacterium]